MSRFEHYQEGAGYGPALESISAADIARTMNSAV